MQALSPLLSLTVYLLIMLGLLWGALEWRLKRRPTRHPLGLDMKLRRQPGEHLRNELGKKLEGLVIRSLVMFIIPGAVYCLAKVLLILSLPKESPWITATSAVVALVSIVPSIWWLCRYADGLMNLKLGLFGERVVADQLEGLKKIGYEVFHDVPCLGGSGPFNLDHVVVGRGVVVVVETKTRRKPKGDKDGHKVSYNGEVLTWSSGATSTRELKQAEGNAEWLRKELKKEEKVNAVVQPVLTFPGWFVNGSPPQAPVTVAAHKMLAVIIEKRFQPSLTQAETDAVVRHLNRLCTNLGYVDVE